MTRPLPAIEVDAIGLLCPLPVLRARKVLADLPCGTTIKVLATDGMAVIDMPHFCAEAGHHYHGMTEENGIQHHLITRGPPAPV